MTLKLERVIGPAHWASYFINGDDSGLTADEKARAKHWLAREGIRQVIDCDEESHFSWSLGLHAPECGAQGGDVLGYTVELEEDS